MSELDAREIEVDDIVMYAPAYMRSPLLGVVVNDDCVDTRDVSVRWWRSSERILGAPTDSARSLLCIIGKLPDWAKDF